LPLLTEPPSQLGWTWAHTQSIKTISTTQAIALLERKNQTGKFNADIEKILLLNKDSTLSIRQKLAPHLRINIVSENGTRSMVKGTLPIVFPRSNNLPIIRPAREPTILETPKTARKDKKIEDDAFIPAIRAYLNKTTVTSEIIESE
jgi:hypothetical protein